MCVLLWLLLRHKAQNNVGSTRRSDQRYTSMSDRTARTNTYSTGLVLTLAVTIGALLWGLNCNSVIQPQCKYERTDTSCTLLIFEAYVPKGLDLGTWSRMHDWLYLGKSVRTATVCGRSDPGFFCIDYSFWTVCFCLRSPQTHETVLSKGDYYHTLQLLNQIVHETLATTTNRTLQGSMQHFFIVLFPPKCYKKCITKMFCSGAFGVACIVHIVVHISSTLFYSKKF